MRFALIGAAGYVAPRHMAAIKACGGELVAALDPHDSVGVLDSYAPGCLYFREPERFERFLLKHPVDYVSVCSPNYLHDSHCIMAMRAGANAICEKPLVARERNMDMLRKVEDETGRRVSVILQCRLHSAAAEVKEAISCKPWFSNRVGVSVDYSTPRGQWYRYSWKGDVEKSGGLACNIGIHLFDLCCWLFGATEPTVAVAHSKPGEVAGKLWLDNAYVDWALSVNGSTARRLFTIGDGSRIDLSGGFTDLHNVSYRKILDGDGFGIEDVRPATRIAEIIRDLGGGLS